MCWRCWAGCMATMPKRASAACHQHERLQFHQQRSGPVMDELQGWLERQFAERKVEPNSGLGKAITYLLRHWRPLTLFLREAGRPAR